MPFRNLSVGREVDHLFSRQRGASIDSYYPAGAVRARDFSTLTASLPSNTLLALPFVGPGGAIDRVAVRVVTGQSGGKARLGIYKARGERDLYPGMLVLDAGDVPCATNNANAAAAVDADLEAGAFYWLVVQPNNPGIAFRAVHRESMRAVLGFDDGLAVLGIGYAASSAPYPFADPFPAGAQLASQGNDGVPEIFVRYRG